MTLIFEAIKALEKDERSEFRQFLRSPFFNSKDYLTDIGEYLLDCTTAQKEPQLDLMLQKADRSTKISKEQYLRLAQSALLDLLEKYLIYKENEKNTAQQKITLLRIFRNKNLPRHYKNTLRETKDFFLKSTNLDNDHLSQQHQLAWEQYQSEGSAQRLTELNIQSCSDTLDNAYLADKLRLACLAVAHQAVYKTQYDLALLPAVLALLDAEPQRTQFPAIGLYYHGYKFLSASDNGEHFAHFKRLLAQVAANFPADELRGLYLLAINYSIKQINQSVEGAVQSTLELYQGALQHQLLIEKGQISRFAFSNIVAIGLRAGQIDWTEIFIEKYKIYLERAWREAIANLCLARLEYERKRYEHALLHLQRADYKDTLNNITARLLQMKIYYETQETESLKSLLKNLKNYIQRHTAIGYHRTNYSNIIHYTEQLMLLDPNDKKNAQILYEVIKKEKILTEKEWLSAQAARKAE